MSSQQSREGASLILRQTGQRFRLAESPVTVGRHPSNAVVLADPQVSRHHARILFQAGSGWMVEDLGSANGTFVNNQRLDRPRRLRHGDVIRFGASALDVQIDAPAPASMAVTQTTPAFAPAPLYSPADYDEEFEMERSGPSLLPIFLVGAAVVLALVVGLTLLLGRGLRSNPAPTVAILSPSPDGQAAIGESITIQVSGQDNQGVTRIELSIDGSAVSTTTSVDARGDPTLTATQTWQFSQPGSHSISAVAFDARGAASAPAVVVVNVTGGVAVVTPALPPTATSVPPATGAPTATDTPVVIIATATPSDTPAPTSTPTSSPTPTPTQTPTPSVLPPPTIEYLRVVPNTIPLGDCARLEWGAVENATRAEIQPGIGGVGTPGSTEVCPTSTTTYVLTATGPGGVVAQDVTLFIGDLLRADLSILGVLYDPNPAVANQPTLIRITLQNLGLGPAGPFRWDFQAGDYEALTGQVTGLGIGASMVVTETWTPTSAHAILAADVRVDVDDEVLESNEDNNVFRSTIVVLP